MKALSFAGQAPAVSDASPTWLQCLAIVGRSHGFNLTISQLVKDNLLSGDSVNVGEMLRCARHAGLKARLIKLGFDDLTREEGAAGRRQTEDRRGDGPQRGRASRTHPLRHSARSRRRGRFGDRDRSSASGGDLDRRGRPPPPRIQDDGRRQAVRLAARDWSVPAREATAARPDLRRAGAQPAGADADAVLAHPHQHRVVAPHVQHLHRVVRRRIRALRGRRGADLFAPLSLADHHGARRYAVGGIYFRPAARPADRLLRTPSRGRDFARHSRGR